MHAQCNTSLHETCMRSVTHLSMKHPPYSHFLACPGLVVYTTSVLGQWGGREQGGSSGGICWQCITYYTTFWKADLILCLLKVILILSWKTKHCQNDNIGIYNCICTSVLILEFELLDFFIIPMIGSMTKGAFWKIIFKFLKMLKLKLYLNIA